MTSAREIREAVGIPVIPHGRLGDISKAEVALKSGICDFADIGRRLLADPELPNKVVEGRTNEIRPYISCNEGCITQVCASKAVGYAVNPFCTKESERSIPKTDQPKKVLVVGAGPSGCAAALLAHEAEHSVEIWEKSSRVGGRVLAAAAPYMKRDMQALAEYYQTRLLRENIPVRFMTCADADSVKAFAPDAVIWATGGKPVMPASIPGLDQQMVCTAENALLNLSIVGNSVVIIGSGLVGIETALHFSKMGKQVTVVEMAETILPKPPFTMNKTQLDMMLAASNIKLMPAIKLIFVESASVIVENESGRLGLPCDTVMMAMDSTPTEDLAKAMEDICPVYVTGEAKRGAADVIAAIEDAYQAVCAL